MQSMADTYLILDLKIPQQHSLEQNHAKNESLHEEEEGEEDEEEE